MDIILDFDGTVVTHEFPAVGKDIGAQEVLKEIVANGHNLILFTMRSDREKSGGVKDGNIQDATGLFLRDAVSWFKTNDIPLYGVQVNPTQHTWTTSPKAYGQIIIDDAALGVPLIYPDNSRPYVDWKAIRGQLTRLGVIAAPASPSIPTREEIVESLRKEYAEQAGILSPTVNRYAAFLESKLAEHRQYTQQEGGGKKYTLQDFFDGIRSIVSEAREWWDRGCSEDKNIDLRHKYNIPLSGTLNDEQLVNIYLKETKNQ